MEKEKTAEQLFEEKVEEIIELIVDKKYIKARDLLLNNNEVDIAEILEDILEEVDPEREIGRAHV